MHTDGVIRRRSDVSDAKTRQGDVVGISLSIPRDSGLMVLVLFA
jgi:hypothetical protein